MVRASPVPPQMPEQPPSAERIARTVDEAQEIILASVEPLPPIDTTLQDALGLTLVAPLVADRDSPPFATAAMDGFAVQAADLQTATEAHPVRLAIAGIQAAGAETGVAVQSGTAVRIMTGAPCPPGSDAVVPFELTSGGNDDWIAILKAVPAGSNIRPQGEEYRSGDELLAAGTVLRPAHLALLAADGRQTAQVRRSARVAVVASGNELRAPGETLAAGQIWDSNSLLIAALCRELGAEVPISLLVSDREDEISTALDEAGKAAVDLIVTVGGISAGDYDNLKHVLVRHGDVELWDVAMKPGRPLAFGSVRETPVIGLPGNPAAAFVSFHQFVRPLLARMMGRLDLLPQTITATSDESFQNRGGRRNFVRVTVTSTAGGYIVRSAGFQGSASILGLARANGLLVIPEDVSSVNIGDRVEVQLLTSAGV